MPISLIPKFAELANAGEDGYSNIAIGVDIRSGHALAELDSVLDDMLNKHFNYTILFLESSDDVLVKRYKETRRTHPLAMDDHDRIDNVIKLERDELKFLKKRADVIIDTSQISLQGNLRQSLRAYSLTIRISRICLLQFFLLVSNMEYLQTQILCLM